MSPMVRWTFEKDNSDPKANEQNKLSGYGIRHDGVQRGQTSLDEVGRVVAQKSGQPANKNMN